MAICRNWHGFCLSVNIKTRYVLKTKQNKELGELLEIRKNLQDGWFMFKDVDDKDIEF